MGLQLDIDRRFHRRERIAERVGSAVVAALVLAAALGLVGGPGPVSSATKSAGGLTEVSYQRFTHLEADDSIAIRTASPSDGAVEVELSSRWTDAVTIDAIFPEPAEQVRSRDGVVLRMPATTDAWITIDIAYRPSRAGKVDGWVRAPGGRVPFWQFVYP